MSHFSKAYIICVQAHQRRLGPCIYCIYLQSAQARICLQVSMPSQATCYTLEGHIWCHRTGTKTRTVTGCLGRPYLWSWEDIWPSLMLMRFWGQKVCPCFLRTRDLPGMYIGDSKKPSLECIGDISIPFPCTVAKFLKVRTCTNMTPILKEVINKDVALF